MIDVSTKKETLRLAKAQAFVKLDDALIERIKNKQALKGDVLEHARVAGVLAAKNTPQLIPLCHPLRISEASVSFEFLSGGIKVTAQAKALERTGVEMEAMTACCVAALTIYDMCKMYDRTIEITDVLLLEKSGGKSGDFKR